MAATLFRARVFGGSPDAFHVACEYSCISLESRAGCASPSSSSWTPLARLELDWTSAESETQVCMYLLQQLWRYVQQQSAIPTSYMHRQQHSCSTGMPAISHAGSLSLSSKRRAKFQQHIQVCHTRPAEQQYILQLGHLLLLSRALRAPPASPGGGALCAAAVSTAALTLPAAPAATAGGGAHHNSCRLPSPTCVGADQHSRPATRPVQPSVHPDIW